MQSDNLFKKYIFLNNIDNQFIKNIDFSQTTISEVTESTYQNVYTNIGKNVQLHDYIFKFYAYNEILASFRNKHNGIVSKDDLYIFKQYQAFANDFSKRIFSFILHSCIAEARHSDFIGTNREAEEKFNEQLVDAFIDQSVNDFKQGKNNKLFSRFLEDFKKQVNSEQEYQEKIKKTHNLKGYFFDFIHSWYDMPLDIPQSFQEQFKKSYVKHYNINPKALGIFKKAYKAHINDRKKLIRFNDFWYFMENINQSSRDGGSGSLQREIIKKKTIQNSKIKDFSVEEVLDFLSTIFLHTFDKHDAYGGKNWATIVQHALHFSQGKINAEIFIDQALSLEHNGGQLFSKSFIFDDNFDYNSFSFVDCNTNNSLGYQSIGMNTKEFVLHLQNSSSVLSLANVPQDWNSLIKNLDTQKLKNIHPELSSYILTKFSDNLTSIHSFKQDLNVIEEMTKLAHKVEYSIPAFDFSNMIHTALRNSQYDIKKFERALPINHLFSHIIQGQYAPAIQNTRKKINQYFKLIDLNHKTAKSLTKNLIGGKAFGLVELINKGFNVPKALVFDTKTCLSYLDNHDYFHSQYASINDKISSYLLDKNNQPLLVSVRSGAPVSMPGMMDSILNVGIDDSTYPKLCEMYGKKMINQCAISFMSQFCYSKLGLNIIFPKNLNTALDKFAEILIKNDIPCYRKNNFPLSKEQQVKLCVEAVFDSWNSPRACAWRIEKNIPNDLGTAATIQQMVFGNKNENSLTCVIFSRDCVTGKPEIMGEYLTNAQGEDLVSGKKTPLPISQLKKDNPQVYQQIQYIAKVLEEEKQAVQDLEITVEDNQVYVLQMRNAVVSHEAQLVLAKELNLNLLDIVTPKDLIGEYKIATVLPPQYNGLAASPGLISGIVVKTMKDIEKYKHLNKPMIFFANQALPEHAPILIATSAFITQFGGATSHAAILARSMQKPCIVGIGNDNILSGTVVTLDATEGKIWKEELAIEINQENAIDLSIKLLKENNIDIPKTIPKHDFSLQSWTTQLSKSIVLNQPKNNKNNSFLNIAQKTALLLQIDNKKQILKK